MRILFLAIDIVLDDHFGATIHTLELAKAYRDLGHEVVLYAGAGEPPDELHDITVEVVSKRFSGFLRFLNDIRIIWRGFWGTWSQGIDVIYERRFSCKIGLMLKWILRKPLLVEINGLVDEESFVLGSTRFINKKASGWSLHFADHIIVVAPRLGSVLANRYGISPDRVTVVSNGVNPGLFYHRPKREVCQRIGWDSKTRRLCFVGNFARWYDFYTMLQAFAEVSRNQPKVRLILVGDGSERPYIEELIKKFALERDVDFLGKVPYTKIPEIISASDICLAPLAKVRNENIDLSPIKLFEYVACARRVISTDIGGLNRYAQEIPSLVLVPPEAHEDLADQILFLLGQDTQEEVHASADIVRTRYTWHNSALKIIQVMQKYTG